MNVLFRSTLSLLNFFYTFFHLYGPMISFLYYKNKHLLFLLSGQRRWGGKGPLSDGGGCCAPSLHLCSCYLYVDGSLGIGRYFSVRFIQHGSITPPFHLQMNRLSTGGSWRTRVYLFHMICRQRSTLKLNRVVYSALPSPLTSVNAFEKMLKLTI